MQYAEKDEIVQLFSNEMGTYNVSILWRLAPKSQLININQTKGHSCKLWGNNHPSPKKLLQLQSGEHWDIAMKADLRYPILLTPTLWIADGNHRVVKALHLGKKHIRARIFKSYDDMTPALIKHHPQNAPK